MIYNEDGVPIDYRFLEVNPFFEKLTGFVAKEILGKRIKEIIPNVEPIWIENYGKVSLTGEALTFQNYSKDLDRYFEVFAYRPSFGCFAAIFTDISERIRVEKEREKMQKELLFASKLASVGELAAGVAHEINNPLTIAMGFNELIKEKLERLGFLDSQLIQYFSNQEKAFKRISNIVNGLKTYARVDDSDSIETVNIHEVVNETLALIEGIYAKDRIHFEKKLNCESPFLRGHSGAIQQVIMNLISNSRDALIPLESQSFIHIETSLVDKYICIQVSDKGQGISKEILPQIFSPFFTTKSSGKGTGLGLSISQSIINSMKGKIEVESEIGLGTDFKIYLPHLRSGTFYQNESVLEL